MSVLRFGEDRSVLAVSLWVCIQLVLYSRDYLIWVFKVREDDEG